MKRILRSAQLELKPTMGKTLIFILFATMFLAPTRAVSKSLSVQDICEQMSGDVLILRPNTCNNWVKCSSSPDGLYYDEGFCAHGLYFNKDSNRCDSVENVACPFESTQTQKSNRCAVAQNGAFLADPDNCSGYIFCENRQETRSNCPNGLVFHPDKSACVYPKEYKCPKKPANISVDPICSSVGIDVLFADITDCSKYHRCTTGDKLESLQCSEGQAFNYTNTKCVPRNSAVCHPLAPELEPELDVCGTDGKVRVGYIPDTLSCSGYYICANQTDGKPDRKPARLKCQEGYFFDKTTWSCRDRLNVKCPLDRCEGMDNKYVNVAGDCAAYARCKNGVTITSGKCEPDYFFDERNQGCTPHKISYVACSA